MNQLTSSREKRFNLWINIVSVAIPVVVAVLFRVRLEQVEPLGFLPPIYAGINGLTAVLLVAALFAIKNGQVFWHRTLTTTCMGLSLIFLIMYVAYHMTSDSTAYGREGFMKYLYYFILISHILLSIVIVPLVLRTFLKAYLNQMKEHRRWAKITFPIWLYVTITGVIVYFMISPYYTH